MAEIAPRTEALPRWLLVLARVRQWLAVAVLAFGAYPTGRALVAYLGDRTLPYEFDPAPLIYVAGIVGLAVRAFWARYLAISFAAAIVSINVFWGRGAESVLLGLAFILLLSGPSMRSLFEDRAGRLNRWAAGLDARVGRLRLLFVAQAVALAILWAPGATLSPLARPLTIVAGLALAGLVFQVTWGALVLVPVLGVELYLAWLALGTKVHWGSPPAWAYPATLVAAAAVSLAVIAPFLRAFARGLAVRRDHAT